MKRHVVACSAIGMPMALLAQADAAAHEATSCHPPLPRVAFSPAWSAGLASHPSDLLLRLSGSSANSYHADAQQVELGAPVRLPLDQLQAVYVTLDASIAVPVLDGGPDTRPIPRQNSARPAAPTLGGAASTSWGYSTCRTFLPFGSRNRRTNPSGRSPAVSTIRRRRCRRRSWRRRSGRSASTQNPWRGLLLRLNLKTLKLPAIRSRHEKLAREAIDANKGCLGVQSQHVLVRV